MGLMKAIGVGTGGGGGGGGGGGAEGALAPPILGIMCIKYAEFILDTPFGPLPILFTFLLF